MTAPLTDPDCPHSVREKLAAKADRIADIIERNNFRQNEKVEDAKQIAHELARELRALSVRDQINGGVTQEAPGREYPTIIEVARTLGFFSSVIKSGEPWTATCQRDYDRANAAIRALTTNQAEREQLEARVKVLEAALTNVRREVEKLHTGYAKMDRSDLRFLMLILDAALQEQRP